MITLSGGVVDDVGELVGEKPYVQGVQHGPHRGDGEVGLEVLLVIEAERRHPVAPGDAETLEAGRKPLGAPRQPPRSWRVESPPPRRSRPRSSGARGCRG